MFGKSQRVADGVITKYFRLALNHEWPGSLKSNRILSGNGMRDMAPSSYLQATPAL